MSDALSNIARYESEKFDYLAATVTISQYISIRATNRPKGKIRDKYLELAYNEVIQSIKNQVIDSLEIIDGERR